MREHIKVTAANGDECIIFTDCIVIVQDSKSNGGAYIYTTSKAATILTQESYKEVLEMIGISFSNHNLDDEPKLK